MNEQLIGFEAPKLALTRVEAAKALNISPATLDRLTLRGLLRPSRALRRPLYSINELNRFLRETTGSIAVEAEEPDRSIEAFQHLRHAEPRRLNDYDERAPWETRRAK